MLCNGAEIEIEKYPKLAELFEYNFGKSNFYGGDGVNTFAVPNLQGEFLRGAGKNSHTLKSGPSTYQEGSGSDVGVHQAATRSSFLQVVNEPIHYGHTYSELWGISGTFSNSVTDNYDFILPMQMEDDVHRAENGTKVVRFYNNNLNRDHFTNTDNTPWVHDYYSSRPTNTSVQYIIKY